MLIIRVKWLKAVDYKLLRLLADFVGYDSELNLYVYRLNPVKAAKMGLDRVLEIANRLNVYIPLEVRKVIKQLSDRDVDAYFVLEKPDIVLYTHSNRLISELRSEGLIKWDSRSGTFRLKPIDLHKVLNVVTGDGLRYELGFNLDYRLSFTPRLKVRLRDYQVKALNSWINGGCRGVIALPVATGKTIIALKAIEYLKVKTLILVPTIDLLNQWYEVLIKKLGVPVNRIGVFGGGKREINEITVMTYDSASINLENYPTYFGLVIADECHHAVSPSYRRALELITAPYRMGLTATPLRSNGLHKYYGRIIGGIIYRMDHRVLQEEGYLAKHREKRIYIELSDSELREYYRLMNIYLEYCRRNLPKVKDPKLRFKKVLELAAKDPKAREALRAKHKARQIALNAERKIKVIEELLKEYPNEKIIIFSRYTDVIRKISRRFLIPRILHDTPKDERKEYLKLFREGKIRVLATAMALDEGVDVPDASIAIIISGTGSHREYVQRLGRILRPKEKEALLIELITKKTVEPSLAKRRRRFQIFLEEE